MDCPCVPELQISQLTLRWKILSFCKTDNKLEHSKVLQPYGYCRNYKCILPSHCITIGAGILRILSLMSLLKKPEINLKYILFFVVHKTTALGRKDDFWISFIERNELSETMLNLGPSLKYFRKEFKHIHHIFGPFSFGYYFFPQFTTLSSHPSPPKICWSFWRGIYT